MLNPRAKKILALILGLTFLCAAILAIQMQTLRFMAQSVSDSMIRIAHHATSTTVSEGNFCGGIAAFQCPAGYTCKLDGAYPDAGGHCVKPDGTGSLRGQVVIGPNCPVERPGMPCPAPPEAYASREFLVLSSGQKKTITSFHADMSGNYIVSLPPGNYVIVSAKTGMGFMSKDLPVTVTIKSGETSTFNINIDTGIR